MSRFHIRAARILARTHAPTHKKGRQTQIQSCVFVYLCVWLCQATNDNNFFTKNLFWLIEQLKIAVVEIYIQLMKFLTLVWRELLQCEKCWQPRLFMQIRGLNSLSDLYYRKWFLKIMQKTLLDWTQKTKKVELFRINYCYSKAWFGPFAFQGSLIVSYFGFAVLIWIIVDFASLFTSSEKKRIEHTFFVFLLCEPFYSCHYASLRWSFPKLSLNLYRSCKAKMWLKRNF